MPHHTKSAADWEISFRELASCNDVDLKGKHPRDKVLRAKWDGILNCPARKNKNMQTTSFGEKPASACNCGYGEYHGRGIGEKSAAERNHNPTAETTVEAAVVPPPELVDLLRRRWMVALSQPLRPECDHQYKVGMFRS